MGSQFWQLKTAVMKDKAHSDERRILIYTVYEITVSKLKYCICFVITKCVCSLSHKFILKSKVNIYYKIASRYKWRNFLIGNKYYISILTIIKNTITWDFSKLFILLDYLNGLN